MTDDLSAGFEQAFGLEAEANTQPEASVEQPQEASTPPTEQAPAAAPEVQQPQEAPQEEAKGHTVPLATFLDQRLEAREAKRKADDLERQIAEMRQAKVEPVKIPDPYEDPDGYNRYVQESVRQTEWNMRAEMSGRFAEQKYGKETVEAAVAWAQSEGFKDPTLGQRVQMQPSPVEWVVEQYNRDQLFQRIQSDPTLAAQLSGAPSLVATHPGVIAPQPAAAFQPVVVTPKQAPPKSLATAPSTGAGHQAIPEGSALDSLKFNLG